MTDRSSFDFSGPQFRTPRLTPGEFVLRVTDIARGMDYLGTGALSSCAGHLYGVMHNGNRCGAEGHQITDAFHSLLLWISDEMQRVTNERIDREKPEIAR